MFRRVLSNCYDVDVCLCKRREEMGCDVFCGMYIIINNRNNRKIFNNINRI